MIIETQDLKKLYRTNLVETTALDSVNFCVDAGQFVSIVHQPNLVLADEPTGNLDSEHGAEVMKILVKLHEAGTSILMVTHSPDNAAYAERTVRMVDGRILAEQRHGQPS